MISNSSPQRIQSVHRALVIIKLMSKQGSISVSEAATELLVNPSTAYRLLDTLVSHDFAVQIDQRRYYPGPALLAVGRGNDSITSRERLRPLLEELYIRTNETVHLASLVGTTVYHHDCIEAREHTLVFTNRLHKTPPAHSTSQGKAMLADLSTTEVEGRYLVSVDRPATAGTMERMRALHHELEFVRQRGFATNFEESERGIAAMAVSIGPVEGESLALSVALPITRYSEEVGRRISQALLEVKAKATNLSQKW